MKYFARVRRVYYYRRYYLDFYETLSAPEKTKINWVIQLIETTQRVPSKFLRFINGTQGIYEIRLNTGSNLFRVFCFFDSDAFIILINGFKKKTKKTPRKEIVLAEKLRKQYYDEKYRR